MDKKENAAVVIGDHKYTRRKNRRKRFRTLLQVLILALFSYVVWMGLFHHGTYVPAEADGEAEPGMSDTGFVALSYFGVDRIGNKSDLIGKDVLEQHLAALHRQGYVTITQTDIEEYYKEGKRLPDRSLFLMFEDGRRDTAIFAQKILEKYNFKATMLTYPEKFDNKDLKFLSPEELKDLERTSFWEMGSNGYRLQFINVFDRHGNYLGELDPVRFAKLRGCLVNRYNHYLMDYIRDKEEQPKESYNHMKRRISYDYERLRYLYATQLDYVPRLYTIMHANTGAFGNNRQVSDVNEKWIREIFTMNFNREGYCFNQRGASIYDLTRMQPQPHWSTNHLLMRIKHDINQYITFETGKSPKAEEFDLLQGAMEFTGDTLTVTSEPENKGMVRLKGSEEFGDVHLKVRLQGNVFGNQRIYLRASDSMLDYVCVCLANGQLVVNEMDNENYRELFRAKLTELDGVEPVSVAEDKRAVEVQELETFARYAPSTELAQYYLAKAAKRAEEPAQSLAEGGKEYVPPIPVNSRGDRALDIVLQGDRLTVTMDGTEICRDAAVRVKQNGSIYFEGSWNKDAWSQRNLADDVYDGVFKGLEISVPAPEAKEEQKLFSAMPVGMELYRMQAEEYWEKLLDAFITNL